MNSVVFIGNLTKDVELRYPQGSESTATARFTIAVKRRFNNNSDVTADFFNCVCFGQTAEFCERNFKQGSAIALKGRIQNNNYTNKNNETVYGTQVIAEEVDFAGSKKKED